jgi:hypothetical protein
MDEDTRPTPIVRWENRMQITARSKSRDEIDTAKDAEIADLRAAVEGYTKAVFLDRGELSEWRRLKDPTILHATLLRGLPARLAPDQLRHIAGDFSQEPAKVGAGQGSLQAAGVCAQCGCVGLHACPGEPIEPWAPEKIAEFNQVLSEYESESSSQSPSGEQTSTEAPTSTGRFTAEQYADADKLLAKFVANPVADPEF